MSYRHLLASPVVWAESHTSGKIMIVSNRFRWTAAVCCTALCVALVSVPVAAQTYSVKVHPQLNDLDIRIETVESTGVLVVKLTNATGKKVRCDLRYDAAPQTPYRKTTYVDPGKTEQSVFQAKRKWMTVDVNVECKAVEK
jgi:hypothetical protein